MAGFIVEKRGVEKPVVPADFTHALCTGETGSGKTSGFMLPNIEERIVRGHGIFAVDFKGNLHAQIKSLAQKHGRLRDVVEIGTPWGEGVNLLEGTNRTLFSRMLDGIVNEEKRDFWHASAVALGLHVYDILTAMEDVAEIFAEAGVEGVEPPYRLDLPNMGRILQQASSLEGFLRRCRLFLQEECYEVVTKLPPFARGAFRQAREGAEEHLEFIRSFVKDIDESSPAAGSGGVLFSLRQLVQAMSDGAVSGSGDLMEYLEDGKIVVIRSDAFSDMLTRVFMQMLFTRLSRRLSHTPVTLFVDEFQRVVGSDNLPHVDVFREKRVELIAAVQNIRQLENRVGERVCDEFLGNILHRYEFANHLENDLERFEYRVGRTVKLAKPVFLTEYELDAAQYAWQKIWDRNVELPGKWVYLQADRSRRCFVKNMESGEVRPYFFVEMRYRVAAEENRKEHGEKVKERQEREEKIFFD